MKRHYVVTLFFAITLITASQSFAVDQNQRAAGEDIVRMWKANLSPDTILLFVRQADIVFTADDVALMAEAGLPDRFIRDLLKAAGSSVDRGYGRSYPVYYGTPYYDPWYYPRYFYYGGPYLNIHLGGHFLGHHYGHFNTIGHRSFGHGGYATHSRSRSAGRYTNVSHGTIGHRSGGHRFSGGGGHIGGGHSRGGHSRGGHSGGGHRGH